MRSCADDSIVKIEEDFAEEDLDANLQRDKHARVCATVNQLVEELVPNAPDYALRETCDQLVRYSLHTPNRRKSIGVVDHGYRGCTRDAVAACFLTWYAGDSRGAGGQAQS